MLIDEKALEHWIDNFYGYGSWQARFWFIGHEDGGGELPEEVADKLNYFQRVHAHSSETLCDIRELYKNVSISLEGLRANLFQTLYEHRFGNDAIQHGVWKNLIAFVHGYRNEKLPDLRIYQQQDFVSPAVAREALIHLYPLPSPHNHAWYYSWLPFPQLSFLKRRAIYEEHLYPQRIHYILSRINTYKPEVVLMYGMDNINALKKSVQAVFHGVKFQMVKATKLQIPQHHRADINGTTLLITTQIPALRHNRVETGFDWWAFAQKVKAETSINS